jgi:hypothetical protein
MTFALIIFDLKDLTVNIQTQNAHEILNRKYHHENYAQIKNAMLAKGYSDKAHTTKTQLPHNCLVKDNISQQQAITDLIEAVKKHEAVLENYMAVTVNSSYQADASLL